MNRSNQRAKKLADIAHLAGVSESTASRALQDSKLINHNTKARIQALAKKHNYRPNWTAQSLRRKQSNTIVLVLPMNAATDEIWSNPFVFKFLSILGSKLHHLGYDLLVSQTTQINSEIESRYFRSGRADGFIFLGRGLDPQYLNKMAHANVPFVVWGPILPEQKYCSVGIDNIAAGKMVVDHLIKLGRRRIAIIADDESDSSTESHLRYLGYCQALAQAGIECDDKLFASANYSAQSGYQSMKDLLNLAPDLDAVFVAYSDVIAIAAMQALNDAGKRVPQDVSVVGFDNINLAAFTNPPLTTVGQSLEKDGIELLVQKLHAQISGDPTVSIMLNAELVVRRSCGSEILAK